MTANFNAHVIPEDYCSSNGMEAEKYLSNTCPGNGPSSVLDALDAVRCSVDDQSASVRVIIGSYSRITYAASDTKIVSFPTLSIPYIGVKDIFVNARNVVTDKSGIDKPMLLLNLYQKLSRASTGSWHVLSHAMQEVHATSSKVIFANNVHSLLRSFSGLLPPSMVERLRDLSSVDWDEEDQRPLQPQSLKALAYFWNKFQPKAQAQLTLTIDGNIVGEWRRDKSNLFVVEFLTRQHVKFIHFHRYGSGMEEVSRVSGKTVINELPETVVWAKVESLLNGSTPRST